MMNVKSPTLLLAMEIIDLNDEVQYLRAENAALQAEAKMFREAWHDQYMSSQVQLHNWVCKIMDGSLIINSGQVTS